MIGIFDSGIGGLTVVRAIMADIPGYDIIYFGDTARTPYGNKSARTVIDYSLKNTEFLLSMGAKIIVIACNTASSTAADTLQHQFDLPIFEVVTPGAKLAVETSRTYRFGVMGTRSTVNSGLYKAKILALKPDAKVFSVACPLLVPLVEEGWIKRPETTMIIKKYLHPLKMKQIDTLILGCTHYPVLHKQIQRKIGARVRLVDSAMAVTTKIKAYFNAHPEIACGMSQTGTHRFFVSDSTDQFKDIAQFVLKRRVDIEEIKL